MPLVIPGMMNASGGNQQDSWMNKLMGKKLTDSTTDANSFAKKELPQNHRIVDKGSMQTMDHDKDRLNVHVADDGTVNKVTFQ